MQYKDINLSKTRFKKPEEVETLHSKSYSKNNIDFQFEYLRGDEQRRVCICLTREEAISVKEQIEEFLRDKDWE